jgi:hypothetical protein
MSNPASGCVMLISGGDDVCRLSCCQTVGRHIIVDSLIFVRVDDVRLVPNADGSVFLGPIFLILLPRREMQAVAIPCVVTQGLKGVPILDEPDVPNAGANNGPTPEQSRLGVGSELSNHSWGNEKNRQPSVKLPERVDSEADVEDNKLFVAVSCNFVFDHAVRVLILGGHNCETGRKACSLPSSKATGIKYRINIHIGQQMNDRN